MIWLLACSEPAVETLTVSGVELDVASPVLDPLLDDVALQVTSTLTGDELPECAHIVEAVDPAGRIATLLDADAEWGASSVTWDGLADDGTPFEQGIAQVQSILDCPDGVAIDAVEVDVLRLAPVEIDFWNDVPLAYHKASLDSYELTLVDMPVWIDGAEPWADPDRPPWGDGEPEPPWNLPVGQVAGETMQVSAVFSDSVETDRTVLVGDDVLQTWAPGAELTFTTPAAPTTVGRDELELTWSFHVVQGDTIAPVPGTFTSTHPRYVVVDQPWVPDGTFMGGSPSVAWIGVLEDVNEATAGIEADDHFALMDALRDHLHEDAYLVYNPSDSAYSSFSGSYITWTYTWVEMSEWLDRSSGVDLYCHSLACVLSSQANHLGLPAEYVTLAYNFQTNLTRAAGSEDWQQWSFNSHGVVTVDGEHIWDAAVDYDGDDDPANEPVTPVSAKGVPFDEYLELLTADEIGQVNGGRCFVF